MPKKYNYEIISGKKLTQKTMAEKMVEFGNIFTKE